MEYANLRSSGIKVSPIADFDGTPARFDSDKPTIDVVERIAKVRGVSMPTVALA